MSSTLVAQAGHFDAERGAWRLAQVQRSRFERAPDGEGLSVRREALPELKTVLSIDGAGPGTLDLHAEMARYSTSFTPRAATSKCR